MMKKKNKLPLPCVVIALLSVLLVITIIQSYQIFTLSSEIKNIKTFEAISEDNTLQQIIEEITPQGTPDYGAKAGVSYNNVEAGLSTLAAYHQSISLSGNELERYITIATTNETACEFCCSIGEGGFGTTNGNIACGCLHNIAFSGLTKWLIKNTEYTNQQIINEIHNWKVLAFPQGALEKELQKRNLQTELVKLPTMVGGC